MQNELATGSFHEFVRVSDAERDLIAELLADKRSEATRRAYGRDLDDFFRAVTRAAPTPERVVEFLSLPGDVAIAAVTKYKALMIQRGLAEATVNRRLSAIRSLVRYAGSVGRCDWSLQAVRGEKVKAYRDTAGITPEQYAKVIAKPDPNTLKGKRDRAILRLLWDNILRRGEVSRCDVGDFDAGRARLAVLRKGRGTQRQWVQLSAKAVAAVDTWLAARRERQEYSDSAPLFVSVARNGTWGHRLTGSALYAIVRGYAKTAGLSKIFSPHRARHSGATAVLEATGGDVLALKELGDWAQVETAMIYNDNRESRQRGATEALSELL